MAEKGKTDAGKKNADDLRFERRELGDLLRLFSALGATVAAGIAACFFLGVKGDEWLGLRGAGRLCGVLLGLGATGYWAYLRLTGHLKKYLPEEGEKEGGNGG